MIESYIKQHLLSFKAYSSARDSFKGEGVLLDANESPDGSTGLNRYPDPIASKLVSLIASKNNLDDSNVLVCSGSDEAYDLIFKLFIEKGDNVLGFKPSYGMYRVLADFYQANYIELALEKDFSLPLIKSASFKNAKLLIICRPNNPTGNLFKRDSILDLLNKFKGIVVIDEAYIEFKEDESFIHELENYPNLIITRTFSKAYALAGARVGYMLADKSVINYMKAIKLPYNISKLSVDAAFDVLINKKSIVDEILNEKERLYNQLKQFSFINKIYPSDSNFILTEISDADTFYSFCFKKSVIIRRIKTVVDGIRISIGSKEENDQFLTLCKEYEAK
jgi:histidinol-phosphate aminotransferase